MKETPIETINRVWWEMLINKYEQSIFDLIEEFTKRFYFEVYNQKADEFDIKEAQDSIIWNRQVRLWPVNINDLYFSTDDMYISIANNISMVLVENWYNDSLDAHMEWKELWINLYNYWRKSVLSKEEIEKELEEDLKIRTK